MAHHPQQRGDIRAIILSPARELAMQTAREAETLLTFFPGAKVSFRRDRSAPTGELGYSGIRGAEG
jgi:hypothetical protein